jgi:hypothetical protein
VLARGIRVRAIGIPVEEVYLAASRVPGEAARHSRQPRSATAACRRPLPQVRSALAHGRQVQVARRLDLSYVDQ